MATVAIKGATIPHFVDTYNFLATGRESKPPEIGSPLGGIDSLGFERADRRMGKVSHRQNGESHNCILSPPKLDFTDQAAYIVEQTVSY